MLTVTEDVATTQDVKLVDAKKLTIVLAEWRPYKSLYELSLGLQFLGGMLREAKHDVHIFVFENRPIDSVCQKILSVQPDVVGLQLYRETADQTFSIARGLKAANPDITIVLGGHTATLHAAQILHERPEVDIIACGEGELTFVDLCNRLQAGRGLDGCKGIVYRRKGEIQRNPPREIIRDLDQLPMPVLDVVYAQTATDQPAVIANMQTSRGCMAACAFCVENRVYENRVYEGKGKGHIQWRGKSPEVIIGEIERLKGAFPDKRLVIRFTDSSFEDPDGKTKQRLRRIIELIEEHELELAFSCFTRAESWPEEEEPLLQRMRKAGLCRVNIGFETGSRISLKNVFRKRANVEDNLCSADLFRRNGVSVFGYSIMFHPFVLLDELRVNADFLQRVSMSYHPEMWSHDLLVHIDTRLFRHTAANGLILGPAEDGYIYAYAFEDGRVGKIHRTAQRVRNLKTTMQFGETTLKIELERDLYNIWKDRYEEMQRISDEMSAYNAEVKRIYDQVGRRQYDLFMELVDAAEQEKVESIQDRIVDAWEQALNDSRRELEQAWIQCRMAVGRKGVRLV